jgi:glutamyl-tRNA reductase
MQLVAVGVEQTSAHDQLAARERLAWQGPRLVDALQRLGQRVDDALILSTCHRTEVYAASHEPESGVETLRAFFAEAGAVSRAVLDGVLREWRGREAVEHLFAVASGLRSIALGEHQILSQLKSAVASARMARVLGPTTHRLGCAALAGGQRIRTETSLGRRARSIVSIAVADVASR